MSGLDFDQDLTNLCMNREWVIFVGPCNKESYKDLWDHIPPTREAAHKANLQLFILLSMYLVGK